MKHNGTEVKTMTYNGHAVNSWVHNGVEVFTAEREIYSAGLEFNYDVPYKTLENPYVDNEYISSISGTAHADSTTQTTTAFGRWHYIGKLTDKALSDYKYVKIYYTAGVNFVHRAGGSSQNVGAYIYNGSSPVVRVYTSTRGEKELVSEVYTIPTREFANIQFRPFGESEYQGDVLAAGIGITKLVLTNKKPST